MKNGDFPWQNVSSPEGIACFAYVLIKTKKVIHFFFAPGSFFSVTGSDSTHLASLWMSSSRLLQEIWVCLKIGYIPNEIAI